MAIIVRHARSHITVQDAGRFGWIHLGYARAGALDSVSYSLANLLVGNHHGEGCLEITWGDTILETTDDLIVALTGADLAPQRDGIPFPLGAATLWRSGEQLSLHRTRQPGARTYLAVAGGIEVPAVLGSRSTDPLAQIGGWEGCALRTGDIVPVGPAAPEGGYTLPSQATEAFARLPLGGPLWPTDWPQRTPVTIGVIRGPQDSFFSQAAINQFLNTVYRVQPASDRMGLRLEGSPLPLDQGTDIPSEGVSIGSIQIPADGRPLILLADSRGIGGYAKIATVISAHLHRLAQLRPGDTLTFQEITIEQAQEAIRAQRHFLDNGIQQYVVPAHHIRCLLDGQEGYPPCPRTLDCMVSERCRAM